MKQAFFLPKTRQHSRSQLPFYLAEIESSIGQRSPRSIFIFWSLPMLAASRPGFSFLSGRAACPSIYHQMRPSACLAPTAPPFGPYRQSLLDYSLLFSGARGPRLFHAFRTTDSPPTRLP